MATALIMVATNPFWVIILSICIFGDKILAMEVVGIVVCLGGIAMLTYSEHHEAIKDFEEKKANGEVSGEE